MNQDDARKIADALPYSYTMKNPDSQLAQLEQDLKDDEIMNHDEKRITRDIEIEFKKKISALEAFLHLEYASFSNKVVKCSLNRCYEDIYKERSEITECKKSCQAGIENVRNYTESSLASIHDQFNICLKGAQKGSYTLEGSFQCYDKLSQGIDVIKLDVRQEFNYYQ